MEQEDFYELFYSNLKNELKNEEKYVDSLKNLISNNKLTKNSFIDLIERQYHE